MMENTNLSDIRILMVEDTLQDAELILRTLRKGGFRPVHKRVMSSSEMLDALKKEDWDIILSDFHLPGFGAQEAKKVVDDLSIEVPFIIVSGAIGEETAVEMMRAGAADFVMKDNLGRLVPVIQREFKELKNRRERKAEFLSARSAIEESENQFKALADSIPTLAWMAHADGFIFWYNERWYEFTGTTSKDMEGWGWQSVHDPNILPNVMEKWKSSITTGKPFEMEFPLRSAEGEFQWFLTRVIPVHNSEGLITRWFGTNTNIDDQIKIREELKKAVTLRDDFLSIASHELKTPITSLKLQIQLLMRNFIPTSNQFPSPERIEKVLTVTTKQIERLTKLIDVLLDVSKIQSTKLALEFEKFDVSELIQDVIERFGDELKPMDEKIEFNSMPVFLWADRFRLEQVIVNLLTNAMKYGEKKLIRIKVVGNTSEVVISVQDSGMGIEKEKQSTIFDRFERAVSHNNISGLGLGLFIAKEIIVAHKGKISVESAPSEGSIFKVHLPVNGQENE